MSLLLQQPIDLQTARRPNSCAVVLNQETITYGQLNEQSNQLAWMLKAAGCKKGDRICSLVPKSPRAIVSLIGILKADCTYVPIDSASPAPRVAKIVDSCQPRWILATERSVSLLDELKCEEGIRRSVSVVWMSAVGGEGKNFKTEFGWDDIKTCSSEPLDYQNTPDDPAQILFTSGSTGTPKGVVITHLNIMHFIEWATKYFGLTESDRVSGHPPLNFDLATFDIFGTLSTGAQLHLVPPELNLLPNKLADFVRTSELTQWFSVPSVLDQMARFDVVRFNDFQALKRVIWCGEAIRTSALIYWMKRLPKVSFTNLYGPTETTIASSYYTVPECPVDDKTSIPIGVACEGEQLLVLDEMLQPIPKGKVGDLYISGKGLSPGYWRDQEKTESAFLSYSGSTNHAHRIYKTGDLAKVGDDGMVYFFGRSDSQIKSRGYRIELGEIETALSGIKDLKECAVVAVNTDGFEGVAICGAYVTMGDQNVTPATLRGELSKLLPSYMLPSRWMALKRLPRNANGKIDRPALKELFLEERLKRTTSSSSAPHLEGQSRIPSAAESHRCNNGSQTG